MCVFKYHAFIYFLCPPPWSGTETTERTETFQFRYIPKKPKQILLFRIVSKLLSVPVSVIPKRNQFRRTPYCLPYSPDTHNPPKVPEGPIVYTVCVYACLYMYIYTCVYICVFIYISIYIYWQTGFSTYPKGIKKIICEICKEFGAN